jgi:hypothetical protein
VLDRLAAVARSGGAVIVAGIIPPGAAAVPGLLTLPAQFAETLPAGTWSAVRVCARDGVDGLPAEPSRRYDLVSRRAPMNPAGGSR